MFFSLRYRNLLRLGSLLMVYITFNEERKVTDSLNLAEKAPDRGLLLVIFFTIKIDCRLQAALI